MFENHFRGFGHTGLLVVVLLACLCASLPARAAGPEPAPDNHSGAELVLRALSLLGVNYKFGGSSPDTGLDCSGLVRHVFRETVGTVLPRKAEEISRSGENIDTSQLRPGDLVFFNTLRRTFSHVGIYIGNDQFVHAPSSGGGVRIEQMSKQYWSQRFNGARRVLAEKLGLDKSGDPARLSGPASFSAATVPLPATALPRSNPADLLQAPPLSPN
jgi:hypothetical protein